MGKSIQEKYKENYASDSEVAIHARRNIQDIVRSYRNFWDPFGELLQNSVDAINRKERMLHDPTFYLYDENVARDYVVKNPEPYVGDILIEVWPKEKRFQISDNGTGMKVDAITDMLCPDSSDKRKGQEYGYKGKGLTYAAFISQCAKIRTRYFLEEDTARFEVSGLLDWLRDHTTNNAIPDKPDREAVIDNSVDISPYNTKIELTLDEDYSSSFSGAPSLDETFSYFSDEDRIDCFSVLLRTKTAIGNTMKLFGKEPIVDINIALKVYNEDGTVMYNKNVPYEFYHPNMHRNVAAQTYSFSKYIDEVFMSSQRFKSIYFVKTDVEIGERAKLKADLHISMVSSTNLTDINRKLGFADYEEDGSHAGFSYGVYLAINGMPTGIKVDDWGSRGHDLQRYFAIVDCELAISEELDAGRKGISKDRCRQLSDEVRAAIRTETYGGSQAFHKYSKYLIAGSGYTAPEDDDFKTRVEEAREQIIEDEKDYPEIMDVLKRHTALKHIPGNEEEVRALFHELLGIGVIKGYSIIYDASNGAVYDCALDYQLELKTDNIYPDDKQGIDSGIAEDVKKRSKRSYIDLGDIHKNLSTHYTDVICGEFKYNVAELLYEIVGRPTSPKVANEIDVLIVWDTIYDKEKYKDVELKDIPQYSRYLHSVTHRLDVSLPEVTTTIYVISLKKILEDLI